MAIFGFGKQKSSTSTDQRAESSNYGYSLTGSSASGISGGSSFGRSAQNVFAGDLLSRIYEQAAGAAAGANTGLLQQQIQQLFTGGTSILERLQGGAGEDYLTRRLSGDSSIADAQVAALGADLGQFFHETLMPGVRGSAVAAGQRGGGREGVAAALAGRDVTRAFASGAGDIRARDQAARDQAAVELMSGRAQAAAAGAALLPQLGDVVQTGFGAELSPWTQLLTAMGGPTTLTETEQSSADFARQLSESFGVSEDMARSLMTLTQRGKSSAFNFNFGTGSFGG